MQKVLSDVSFVLVTTIFQFNVEAYTLICPSQSSWHIRAKVKCNSTLKYFCLYNNVELNYVEGCDGPDWDRKGSKRIYSGFFTRGNCEQHRFQPFNFRTNESLSDCVYEKSFCSEEGQIVHTDVSTKVDRTCSCDFKKNYVFIKTPKNIGYCIPSEEECSCYIKSCPKNLALSRDYTCSKIGFEENQTSEDNNKHYATMDTITVKMKKDNVWHSDKAYTINQWIFAMILLLCCLNIAGDLNYETCRYDFCHRTEQHKCWSK